MIIVTGARGFIGSNLVHYLNEKGYRNLVLVDELVNRLKDDNIVNTAFYNFVQRDSFLEWFERTLKDIDFVFHLGARTDTSELDKSILDKLNLNYSKSIWEICSNRNIPLIYASSAATYGNGEQGYDDKKPIDNLSPLNPYGESKHEFDLWVEKQTKRPPWHVGLKFFNVYGYGEHHKGRMASVIWHAYKQIIESGKMNLFRSHKPEYKNGEQKRDFIHVKDVINVCYWMMLNTPTSGIYNVGTGTARTFIDLINSVFNSLNLEPKIKYIDIPEDIRKTYQYFTEASMSKLFNAGYHEKIMALEEGVEDYIKTLTNQSIS